MPWTKFEPDETTDRTIESITRAADEVSRATVLLKEAVAELQDELNARRRRADAG